MDETNYRVQSATNRAFVEAVVLGKGFPMGSNGNYVRDDSQIIAGNVQKLLATGYIVRV